MKTSLEMTLSFEHIHKDLVDIPCDVQVEAYEGSNDPDDPSEIEVLSIKCTEHVVWEGKMLVMKGDDLPNHEEAEEAIYEQFSSEYY